MDRLFIEAVPILERIEEAGFEAYFVGGSVRDYILGRPINDVDIATSATPLEVKGIFPKTADVGIEHGTVLVILESGTYEITTFRTESGYTDYRRPDSVKFVRSLTEDLQRRDFTINAIAMDKSGVIFDPYKGQLDLFQKKITTVGNPHDRFAEDGLRMMRALRFVSQLNFQLDEETFQSLKENGPILREIAVERILVEFEKLLAGDNRIKALSLLLDSGLYQFLPQFAGQKEKLEKVLLLPLHQLTVPELWAVVLIQADMEDIEEVLRAWKLPLKSIRNVQRIIQLVEKEPGFEDSTFDVFQAGHIEAVQAAKVKAILEGRNVLEAEKSMSIKYENLLLKSMSDLDVTGEDLLSWHIEKPGPWVRKYLELILAAVLNSEITNEKAEIKEWLMTCNLI